jgi:energy-coupling factor transporter ATP-binding protein EcfA2
MLERVWRAQKFTALLVTHDVTEAVTLADRVLLIEDGEIAMDVRVDLPRPRRCARGVTPLEGLQVWGSRRLRRRARGPAGGGEWRTSGHLSASGGGRSNRIKDGLVLRTRLVKAIINVEVVALLEGF